ncbi:hypothetical protein N2152v2_002518 [Parachlorella kessleri]
MRLLGKVKVEHSDLSGSAVLSQTGKDVEIELSQGGAACGQPVTLTLLLKNTPLNLPVVPPVVLYGNRVGEGHLGIKFMRVKARPWDTASKCVQVSLSSPDTEALVGLRNALNDALLRQVTKQPAGTARQPLAPRNPNTTHSSGLQKQQLQRGGSRLAGGSTHLRTTSNSGAAAGFVGVPAMPRGGYCSRPAASLRTYNSGGSGGGKAVSVTTLRGATAAAAGTAGAAAPSASLLGGGAASGSFSVRGVAQPAPTVTSSADSRQGAGAPAGDDLAPLSEEQAQALELVKSGRSIFFTGKKSCAGTGKSLLLRYILRALPCDSTFVTGTTGLAGCALGGITINSFAGIGRAEGDLEQLIRQASRGEAMLRWRRATALIIDEVSMMDGRLFDSLEAIARRVRGSNAPFGGIQLILSGDFHQLPPVAKGGREAEAARKFCFEAESWGRCIQACVQLTRVFRQSDREFVDLLAKVRGGACPEAVLRTLLAACRRPLATEDGILPTKLYTHREDVDKINAQQLGELTSPPVRFLAQDVGAAEVLAAACPARRELELRVGAQVMLLRNLSHRQGLVNGARGVVERLAGSQQLPVVRFTNGEVVTVGKEKWTISVGGRIVAQRLQLPLDLGWAMSVHKCQGMTLSRVEVNLERAFEPGMAYVALSRAQSLEGLRILGTRIAPQALRADPRVVAFYARMRGQQLRGYSMGSP